MSKYYRVLSFQDKHLIKGRWLISLLVVLICSCSKVHVNDQFQNMKETSSIRLVNYWLSRRRNNLPPEFPAPEFLWKDSLNTTAHWHIRLSTKSGKELYSKTVQSPGWRPDSIVWFKYKKILQKQTLFTLLLLVTQWHACTKYSSGRVSFSFSPDSVDASVFYRPFLCHLVMQ